MIRGDADRLRTGLAVEPKARMPLNKTSPPLPPTHLNAYDMVEEVAIEWYMVTRF